ncbi:uncharacterized protein LOC102803747 [Saccoglossus kowalevskii]|uniref:Uncharacterized protein LOC102803747 n=1 Tax=Saccoglossus kowalevskii TaxID=10224 RepID=A0ABM0LZS3_SACKO|nr:PREDICTED: uncharacterized protein LOC102803747 [Saccoglossus kowalevskii]
MKQQQPSTTYKVMKDKIELEEYSKVPGGVSKSAIARIIPYSMYTLELQHGKYYVGKTRHLQEHKKGKGSAYTRKHPVKDYVEVRDFDIEEEATFYECEKTLSLMGDHGVDNVRGSAWTVRYLSAETRATLDHMLKHDSNACYKCGSKDHYSSNCTSAQSSTHQYQKPIPTDPEYGRCGRKGHSTGDCYAKTYSGGTNMNARGSRTGACYKCGRTNHWAKNCYAKTDVHGNRL